MKAVITGDILNSRKKKDFDWVKDLKDILKKYADKNRWEIFRGDSFQLETSPENALLVCFQIKLALQLVHMDARLAIGIGQQSYKAKKVTESNGEAYIFSGECFENLHKKTLAIRSANIDQDVYWNVLFDIAMLVSNRWTPTTAHLILLGLNNPEINQKDMAKMSDKKSQSNISAALKRSGYHEMAQMIALFQQKMKSL